MVTPRNHFHVNKFVPAAGIRLLPTWRQWRGLACWPCVCRKLSGYEKRIFSCTETIYGRSSIPGISIDRSFCEETVSRLALRVSYRMDAGPCFPRDKVSRSMKLTSALCSGPGHYVQLKIFRKFWSAPTGVKNNCLKSEDSSVGVVTTDNHALCGRYRQCDDTNATSCEASSERVN
jgi:hypothetical protein